MKERRLALVAAAGAALTLVVIGASVSLRLGTTLDAGGNAASTMLPAIERGIRLAHRIAASGVALAALAVVILVARSRPAQPARIGAAACVASLTLLLSAIGVQSGGYRFEWITVANVTGGTALACAFWWLSETSRTRAPREPAFDSIVSAGLALAAILAQSALGAAAAAKALAGERALDPWHIGVGPVAIALAVSAALPKWRHPAAWAVICLALAHLAAGMVVAANAPSRSLMAGAPHALLAALVALGLVTLIARDRPVAPSKAR